MGAFSRSKRNKGPEAQVQETILDWLRANRILAFRMQVGSTMYPSADGSNRRVSFGTQGMADILAFPKRCGATYPLWIECKSDSGRQSAFQRSFQDQVEMDGHLYLIARSVDDVAELVEAAVQA